MVPSEIRGCTPEHFDAVRTAARARCYSNGGPSLAEVIALGGPTAAVLGRILLLNHAEPGMYLEPNPAFRVRWSFRTADGSARFWLGDLPPDLWRSVPRVRWWSCAARDYRSIALDANTTFWRPTWTDHTLG